MDAEILGGCCIYPTDGLPGGYAELVKFYILPAASCKGIGRALMKSCFILAIEFGYENLYLESFPELGRALSMYEKAGFTQLDKPLGMSGHFACNIWIHLAASYFKLCRKR